MGAEVSAISILDDFNDLEIAYVTLYDVPHYSLNILSLGSDEMRNLARMPLASVLHSAQTKKYYQHQLVKGGHVFTQFNNEDSASVLSPAKTPMML